MKALQAPAVWATTVPISIGENELHVQVTVGFDVATISIEQEELLSLETGEAVAVRA